MYFISESLPSIAEPESLVAARKICSLLDANQVPFGQCMAVTRTICEFLAEAGHNAAPCEAACIVIPSWLAPSVKGALPAVSGPADLVALVVDAVKALGADSRLGGAQGGYFSPEWWTLPRGAFPEFSSLGWAGHLVAIVDGYLVDGSFRHLREPGACARDGVGEELGALVAPLPFGAVPDGDMIALELRDGSIVALELFPGANGFLSARSWAGDIGDAFVESARLMPGVGNMGITALPRKERRMRLKVFGGDPFGAIRPLELQARMESEGA